MEARPDADADRTPGLGALSTPSGVSLVPALVTPENFLEAAAPKLSREEELYALSLKDLVKETLGEDAAKIANGDLIAEPRAGLRLLIALAASGGQLAPELRSAIRAVAPDLMATVDAADSQGDAQPTAASGGEFVRVVNDLGEVERSTLGDTVQKIVQGVFMRLAERVSPLAATASTSPASEAS